MKIPLHNLLEKTLGMRDINNPADFDKKMKELESGKKADKIDESKEPTYRKEDYFQKAIRTEPNGKGGSQEYWKMYGKPEEKLELPRTNEYMDTYLMGQMITKEEYDKL